MTLTHTDDAVQQLGQQVKGSIFTAGEEGYEKTRWGFNLSNDQHPAVILVAQDAADVIAGVRFAAEAGLNIAVKSTGHGMQLPANDALLVVTSAMKGVSVNVEAQTVRAEAGAVWKDVVDVVSPHGLAPLLGSSPHVGVVGYTLGGGIGWLARKYGLAADSVRSIDVVTADGVLRRASPTENNDLFWGLLGGGGNFGVVTAIEFNLYPVATLYGGFLLYPGEPAHDALRFYRDWTKSLPDELTSSIAVIKIPDMPQMPDAIRGKTHIFMRAAYIGDASEGASYIQKWLDWNSPSQNTFREMPFSDVGTISNDPVDPTAGYGSNEMFDELSDEAISIIVRHATNKQSPIILHELRHAGGAVTRAAADSNAIGNREAQFFFQLGGPLFTPDAKAASMAYIQQIKTDLQASLRGGVYLNFMSGSEAGSRAKDAYLPETFDRLLALKAKYDPENQFRFSYQLVQPETA